MVLVFLICLLCVFAFRLNFVQIKALHNITINSNRFDSNCLRAVPAEEIDNTIQMIPFVVPACGYWSVHHLIHSTTIHSFIFGGTQ